MYGNLCVLAAVYNFFAAGRADAGSACIDHGFCGLVITDAAGSLYAHFGADGFAHERDVVGGSAAGGKAGGSLYVIGACSLCKLAYANLFFIRKKVAATGSKFSPDSISGSTSNDSISYQHHNVTGLAEGVKVEEGGKAIFVKVSENFDTEAEAIAWLKTEAGITDPTTSTVSGET